MVDEQRATKKSTEARAERLKGNDNLIMGKVKYVGVRAMRRSMHEPAVRVSRSVVKLG